MTEVYKGERLPRGSMLSNEDVLTTIGLIEAPLTQRGIKIFLEIIRENFTYRPKKIASVLLKKTNTPIEAILKEVLNIHKILGQKEKTPNLIDETGKEKFYDAVQNLITEINFAGNIEDFFLVLERNLVQEEESN